MNDINRLKYLNSSLDYEMKKEYKQLYKLPNGISTAVIGNLTIDIKSRLCLIVREDEIDDIEKVIERLIKEIDYRYNDNSIIVYKDLRILYKANLLTYLISIPMYIGDDYDNI